MTHTLLYPCKYWHWTCPDASIGGIVQGWILIDSKGCIVAIGSGDADLPKQEVDDVTIDCSNMTLLPGLMDSHIHVAGMGETLHFLGLHDCTSIEDLQTALRTHWVNNLTLSVVQGTHWDQDSLGGLPTRFDLDSSIDDDLPVILWRSCWHIMVVNTKALLECKILVHVKDNDGESYEALHPDFVQPQGGCIDLDEETNLPTGIIRERATEIILAVLNKRSSEEKKRFVKDGLNMCVQRGLTAVQTNDERCFEVYRELMREEQLPIRCFLTPVQAELSDNLDITPTRSSLFIQPSTTASEPSDYNYQCMESRLIGQHAFSLLFSLLLCLVMMMMIGISILIHHLLHTLSIHIYITFHFPLLSFTLVERVKIFSDGSLGAGTAALRTKANSNVFDADGTQANDNFTGIFIHKNSDLVRQMTEAKERGFRLEVHAIGDAAAESVLTSLKNACIEPIDRPVLTHCQILGADLVDSMRDLGCVANVQPSFVPTDMQWVMQRGLEPEHMKYAYCWKRLGDEGIVVSGGSDAPIESCNPLEGIYDAVHRCNRYDKSDIFIPGERLSFAQALKLYTINAAYAANCESFVGKLEVGFAADMIALPDTILKSVDSKEINESILKDVSPLFVMVGGQITHDARSADGKEGAKAVKMEGPFIPGKNGRPKKKSFAFCNCRECL
jgi:predicted amidohydrolase YtcJ